MNFGNNFNVDNVCSYAMLLEHAVAKERPENSDPNETRILTFAIPVTAQVPLRPEIFRAFFRYTAQLP